MSQIIQAEFEAEMAIEEENHRKWARKVSRKVSQALDNRAYQGTSYQFRCGGSEAVIEAVFCCDRRHKKDDVHESLKEMEEEVIGLAFTEFETETEMKMVEVSDDDEAED